MEYVSASQATVELDATNVSPVIGDIQIVNRVIAVILAVRPASARPTGNALALQTSLAVPATNAVLAIIDIQNV